MCSQADDPTGWDTVPVTPQPPRRYVLFGDEPEPRGSVALAVLGEMLEDSAQKRAFWTHPDQALREARERIAAAEAKASEPQVGRTWRYVTKDEAADAWEGFPQGHRIVGDDEL